MGGGRPGFGICCDFLAQLSLTSVSPPRGLWFLVRTEGADACAPVPKHPLGGVGSLVQLGCRRPLRALEEVGCRERCHTPG